MMAVFQLRNLRDIQSAVYMIAQPLLAVYVWRNGLQGVAAWLCFALMFVLSLGISVIHHNHCHVRMWRNKYLNRWTDFYLSILQGHPTFVFYPSHNANHHRYHHGAKDIARTYQFKAGDTNHFWGYLIHPLQACWVLYPLFIRWLARMYKRQRRVFYYYMAQYLAVLAVDGVLIYLNATHFLAFVLLVQLHGLHWLLATNYLQHAHADGHSPMNFARNFEGWVNSLYFNIGLHTAHHKHGRLHWSKLPERHLTYRAHIHPRMLAGPLLAYMFRTYIASIWLKKYRSVSLMIPQSSEANHANSI